MLHEMGFLKGQHECSAKIAGNKSIKYHKNVFQWYFMTKRQNKYYVNVFLLTPPGFVKKTVSDGRVLFINIVSSA